MSIVDEANILQNNSIGSMAVADIAHGLKANQTLTDLNLEVLLVYSPLFALSTDR